MNQILENAMIEGLVKGFARSPLERNRLQEADAELIRLPGTDMLLALTTDSVVEEIESGLYTDPFLIGWMTVIVNASDLAAVGAEPLGLLLNENLPHDTGSDFISKLQDGIRAACSACDLYVLGGDTNFSARMQLGASAVGLITGGQPMTRLGCKPGDYLFGSGRFGSGSGYAFVQFVAARQQPGLTFPYRPQPRIREGRLLRDFASCCMDTSDGLLAALDQLMRLNSVGFVVEAGQEELLDPDTLRIANAANIPAWMALAGPHGEFELVFTVPPQRVDALMAEASVHEWKPQMMGRVVERPGVWLRLNEELTAIDTGRIRNLFVECNSDIDEYFKGLLLMQSDLRQGG
jgi:thiamine-monophosphate kinase